MACCQQGCRVRFVTAAELVTLLVEAQQQGRLARKLAWLAHLDVVILDELGYVPFDKAGADLLFGFVSGRYERRSLVVTTNLPFPRWSEVFLDPTAAAAVSDRIVHHATVLQTAGDSFRLQAAERNRSGGHRAGRGSVDAPGPRFRDAGRASGAPGGPPGGPEWGGPLFTWPQGSPFSVSFQLWMRERGGRIFDDHNLGKLNDR